ncbi:MAG TPA: serine hydrolase domain-containing protein [Thermoanaerobaculia bacterium]|nr:serine hydrolase domain-containing protein [Thermoanaerobaculia bacterium]
MRRLLLFVAVLTFTALAACAQTTQDLDAIAARYYKPDGPGAAVLVIKDGRTLLRKGYGLADLELRVPVTPDNIFRIGSLTKQFTTVAILQQVQRGNIKLDDAITKYLPNAPVRGKTVTIEHLLTHTSGIPSYTDQPKFWETMREDRKPEELLAIAKDVPPDFDPGTSWHYDNSGYILLGMLLEKVTGTPYADYMRKQVFEPAGLKHTDYDVNDKVIVNRAHGYSRSHGEWINAPYISMTTPYAAGALISTVDDLARWNDALAEGKLVDPKLLARAQTSYRLSDGTMTGYGYGWGMRTYEGHRIVEHGGGINGFQSYALAMPDDHIYVVVLANANRSPQPSWIAQLLATTAVGKPYAPKLVALSSDVLDRYAGTYKINAKESFTVKRDGDHLVLDSSDEPTVAIDPTSATTFVFREAVGSVSFEGDKIAVTTYGPVQIGTKTAEANGRKAE